MLIVIAYSEAFTGNAKALSEALKDKWSDVKVNLIGVRGKHDTFSKYQVQLERAIVYNKDSVTDNNTIIDLIEERL